MVEASPIRTAIIGYGYVGRTFHAPLIRATPGFALTVIGSRRPETAVRETAPEARVVSDPLAAATDPDVELVVIASPNESHAVLAEAALSAGKHVVVDKPFTVTLAEARRVAEVARQADRLLSVFQNRRWDSDFLTVQAALAEGRLGTLVHYESRIDRYRPVVQDRWRERPIPGSGLWFDLGAHLVDQALLLFGLPQTVTLHVASQRRAGTSPDWFLAVLTYPHLHAVLSAGVLVSGGSARFTLHGLTASLVKGGVDVQEAQLREGMVPGDLDWGIDLNHATLFDGATGEIEVLSATDGDYRRYYEGVRDAIQGVAPNPVPPAQAIAVMAVIAAGEASAAQGRSMALPLTDAEAQAFSAASAMPQ
ncbi:oxidoreductase [Acidisoma sp.]|uniref:oxidoreductase n=1 Tax=Acidisoma sp. TaxID=1872115 RepID=UPI003B00716D